MKKFVRNALTLALTAGLLTVGSLAVSAAEFKGSGTKEDPYLIETAADFAEMIQSVTDGESTYTDQYFLQTADLDFTGVSYIVNEMNPFDGIYNGQGYILKNLTVNAEFGNDPYAEGNEYLAPFGQITGVLMNVGIEATTVEDAYVAGGLARSAKGDAVIINCYSMSNVIGSTRGTGLVDYVNSHDVFIVNCWQGGVVSGNALVGSAWNGEQAVLLMCYYLDGMSMGAGPLGTSEAVADVNAADFVEKLNANRAEAAELCGVDAADLVEWTVGEANATFVEPAAAPAETAAPETAAPETAAPETAAPETAAPAETAPQTLDMGVIAAAAAVVSAAGYALSRKRR